MEIDSSLYSSIYIPLVEKYIEKYKTFPTYAEDWLPMNLSIPYNEQIQLAVNTAHREGLYEGLNNGFIEGFMQCIEHFNNLELINKSNK